MKKNILFILTLLFTITAAVPVNAASKNVTTKMKDDKELSQISKMISTYTTAMDLSEQAKEGQQTIPLNDGTKLSIGAFVRYYYEDDFGFTSKELKKETKDLFGTQAQTNQIKEQGSEKLLVCTSNKKFTDKPFMYCGGDFGDCIPKSSIQKVTKQKNNVYQIEIQNKIGIYGEKGTESIGKTILTVKKSPSSKYGYVVKNLQYFN